jgi:hypothetical protein
MRTLSERTANDIQSHLFTQFHMNLLYWSDSSFLAVAVGLLGGGVLVVGCVYLLGSIVLVTGFVDGWLG